MLPFSAAIDYAAYQSRPPANGASSLGSTFSSWLVPTQDVCGVNFMPTQQQSQQPLDTGHVSLEIYFLIPKIKGISE